MKYKLLEHLHRYLITDNLLNVLLVLVNAFLALGSIIIIRVLKLLTSYLQIYVECLPFTIIGALKNNTHIGT